MRHIDTSGDMSTFTKSPAVDKVVPTVVVITDLEGPPKSMVFISSERAYATSYRSIVT